MQISRQTRADEVVKMILSSYGSDEPPEKFVLVESLSDSEGKLNILSICNGIKSENFVAIGKTNFYANHSWSNIFARKVDQFWRRIRRVFSKKDNLLTVKVVIREENN